MRLFDAATETSAHRSPRTTDSPAAMRRSHLTATPAEQEDAILKAAVEEIELVGMARASLDVVARQAGVSRSTLYRRFPTRDALLTAVGRSTFEIAMTRRSERGARLRRPSTRAARLVVRMKHNDRIRAALCSLVMRSGARMVLGGVLTAAAALAGAMGMAPTAQADQIGYLINVTLRPTYNFPNAQAALDYGYGLCGRIEAKTSYTDMARQIKTDFNTDDELTVSYLLSQATQELCPGQTWQLRQSAAGYRPT